MSFFPPSGTIHTFLRYFKITKWETGSVHVDRWYSPASLLFPRFFALICWAHKPERNTELSPELKNATGGTWNTREKHSSLVWLSFRSTSYTLIKQPAQWKELSRQELFRILPSECIFCVNAGLECLTISLFCVQVTSRNKHMVVRPTCNEGLLGKWAKKPKYGEYHDKYIVHG